jgi:predicted ATPase/DNA-binding CsgD family transcriptional regulator
MLLSSRQRSNLPASLTTIFGRDDDVAAVISTISQGRRLVTLTGPGGVGKTRLALAVGEALLDAFPDGVRFVSLAPITDPELVLPEIGRAVGVRFAGMGTLAEQLGGHLRNKRLLLILDNFEQVADAGPAITELLFACSHLSALVTSRMRLRLTGEVEHSVSPLPLPSGSDRMGLDQISGLPAVHLFVARAQEIESSFKLTQDNVEAVAEICRRLDGLPLAIELAAAWIRLLPPHVLVSRLGQRLRLLTGGGRDLPNRQKTIRDSIAWSHDLLSPNDQQLFRRLAIFVGGFTLDAAEVVAGDSHEQAVLDSLARLMESSLLRRYESGTGDPRFGMLETVREFGLERLAEIGEEAVVRDRHAAWCINLAEQYWALEASWTEGTDWLARVEPEHDNMRAALAWLDLTGDGEGLLQLAGALHPFWDARCYRAEAIAWLERGLTRGQDGAPQSRFRALSGLGRNLQRQGCYKRATAVHEAQLALAREHGDAYWEAGALHVLGLGALNQERYDEATPLIQEAMAAFRRLGDEGGVCLGHYCSGIIAYGRGDLAAATSHLEAALAWRLDRGSVVNLAVPLIPLALVACDRGDHRAATARLVESLTSWEQDSGGSQEILGEWLAAVAHLAACCGRPDGASRLYGAAEALFDAIGVLLVVPPRSLYLRHVDALRSTLGTEAFAATWAAGRALLLEQAIEEARAVTVDHVAAGAAPPAGAPDVNPALTPREQEVLRLLARWMTDREIADALFISHRTVNAHVASILAKLGVASRREAAMRSREFGLASDSPGNPGA